MSTLVEHSARRWVAFATAVCTLILLTGFPPTARADQSGSIVSAGPLDLVATSSDLNCNVHNSADNDPAFYGSTACATLAVVDGELFGPASIPAGGGASPRTTFSAKSQSGVTGSGTSAAPLTVTTVVGLGDHGVELTQVDTYVPGTDSYDTALTLRNTTNQSKTVRLYRAADCYLANSDVGYGAHGSDWAACLNEDRQRILQFTDEVGTAATYQAAYSSVWRTIGEQRSFDNTCSCDDQVDNGVGLSWDLQIPARGTKAVKSSIAFTPNAGREDLDGDGLKDEWERHGVTIGGVHLPLNEWGARPDHKDVFLQVDWMATHWTLECSWQNFLTGCASRSHDFAPTTAELEDVVRAFKNAPVENPDGTSGISLHIDAGSRSPLNTDGRAWPDPLGGMALQYKQGFFDDDASDTILAGLASARTRVLSEARRSIFHLALLGDQEIAVPGSTGVGESPGTTFFVARGDIATSAQVSRTLMHELGHNIGLSHGGPIGTAGADVNCKPAYRSVMNYLYQLQGTGLDYERNSSQNNPAPSKASIQSCINHGGKPYAESAYDVYADWPALVFDGGDIGGLSAGSLIDPQIDAEPEYADLVHDGLAAEDGDGGVEITGPTVLFADSGPQKVSLRVSNPANADSSYDLHVQAVGTSVGRTVRVPAKSSSDVVIEVPSVLSSDGDIKVSLTPTGGSKILATSSVSLPVLEHDEAAAQAALADVEASGNQLPEEVRSSLTEALEQVVQEAPAPTIQVRVQNSTYGSADRVLVSVTDKVSGGAGSVILSGAGATQTRTTTDGRVTFDLPRLLQPGRYTVTATFRRKANQATAVEARRTFVVAKAGVTAVKVKVTKKPTPRRTGRATYSLKSTAQGVTVDGPGTLVFTKGHKRVQVKVTVNSGRGSAKVPKLAKGKWSYAFVFAGSSTHLGKSSPKHQLKVK